MLAWLLTLTHKYATGLLTCRARDLCNSDCEAVSRIPGSSQMRSVSNLGSIIGTRAHNIHVPRLIVPARTGTTLSVWPLKGPSRLQNSHKFIRYNRVHARRTPYPWGYHWWIPFLEADVYRLSVFWSRRYQPCRSPFNSA